MIGGCREEFSSENVFTIVLISWLVMVLIMLILQKNTVNLLGENGK